jgi:hypothetical protein
MTMIARPRLWHESAGVLRKFFPFKEKAPSPFGGMGLVGKK